MYENKYLRVNFTNTGILCTNDSALPVFGGVKKWGDKVNLEYIILVYHTHVRKAKTDEHPKLMF